MSGECKDLLSGISEYLDGTASEALCAEIRRHMEGCENCRVVVDSARKTIAFYKGDQLVQELPPDFQVRLHGTLRDAWERRQGKV
jgi:hypothetical protein